MLCIYGRNKIYNVQLNSGLTDWQHHPEEVIVNFLVIHGIQVFTCFHISSSEVQCVLQTSEEELHSHWGVCGVFLALSEKLITHRTRTPSSWKEGDTVSKHTVSDSLKSADVCLLLEDKACCFLKPQAGEQRRTAGCFPHLFSLHPLPPSLPSAVISWPEEPSSTRSTNFLFPQAQNPHPELPAVLLESHSSSVWGGRVRRLGLSFISEKLFGVEK